MAPPAPQLIVESISHAIVLIVRAISSAHHHDGRRAGYIRFRRSAYLVQQNPVHLPCVVVSGALQNSPFTSAKQINEIIMEGQLVTDLVIMLELFLLIGMMIKKIKMCMLVRAMKYTVE